MKDEDLIELRDKIVLAIDAIDPQLNSKKIGFVVLLGAWDAEGPGYLHTMLSNFGTQKDLMSFLIEEIQHLVQKGPEQLQTTTVTALKKKSADRTTCCCCGSKNTIDASQSIDCVDCGKST